MKRGDPYPADDPAELQRRLRDGRAKLRLEALDLTDEHQQPASPAERQDSMRELGPKTMDNIIRKVFGDRAPTTATPPPPTMAEREAAAKAKHYAMRMDALGDCDADAARAEMIRKQNSAWCDEPATTPSTPAQRQDAADEPDPAKAHAEMVRRQAEAWKG